MPEAEKSPQTKDPETQTKDPETKSASKAKSAGGTPSPTLSARVEKSLKDVDRLLTKNPEASPQERAMARLEQAKVSALLQLAESIRENKKG